MSGDIAVAFTDKTGDSRGDGAMAKVSAYTDDRMGRARHAYDLCDGDPKDWLAVHEAWFKAVEWFENRPSTGATPGGRWLWCLVKFNATSDRVISERHERAADLLREHKAFR